MRSSDPEEILRSGKGVCAGYSSLFQDMCSRAGITCISVNGYGKGAGYQVGQKIPDESNHAWNMVFLEGRWHLLDSTWGAGNTSENSSKFTFMYNEFYFLTHPALFIGNHYPDKKEHQLLQPTVSRKQFEQFPFWKGSFYNCGLLAFHPETGIIYSENGKVSVIVESQQDLQYIFDVNGNKHGVMKLVKCGMELDVYLQRTGDHELSIYAMQPGSSNKYTWVLGYKIICTAVDATMRIPKCLNNPVGPSWITEEAGLVEPSYPEPVIHTVDGRCTLSFKTIKDLNFLCSLDSDEIKITSNMERRHVFLTQTHDKVEMKVQLPSQGTYVLKIYIRPEGSKSSYDYLCNYLIICTNPSVKWPVFPMTYDQWGRNFELVHPLEGVLPKNTNIPFKLRIPDVTKVCFKGNTFIPLTFSNRGYWEGTCSTTGHEKLIVMIQYNNTNSWQYLLEYTVSK
ncbi:kyphoscoliosis peptidase-like isoform 2-T2 [Leptodactylus fuscus]|uniref:kyphoscoliosis peptidase-like n=1 Tax=Leptodactylus fuscus TaxID=238119 RepID=UPI003F4E6745